MDGGLVEFNHSRLGLGRTIGPWISGILDIWRRELYPVHLGQDPQTPDYIHLNPLHLGSHFETHVYLHRTP